MNYKICTKLYNFTYTYNTHILNYFRLIRRKGQALVYDFIDASSIMTHNWFDVPIFKASWSP